jgi:hypothetical protein
MHKGEKLLGIYQPKLFSQSIFGQHTKIEAGNFYYINFRSMAALQDGVKIVFIEKIEKNEG